MRKKKLSRWLFADCHLEQLEDRRMFAVSDVLISEFMAANERTLKDADGDASDWIELHNNADEAVNLQGLYLADGVDRWQLPDVPMAPRSFLLVFASGKDRTTGELHTNFKLDAAGESVQLLASDETTVIHQYANYPLQFTDRSYGLAMSTGDEATLVDSNVAASYIVPTDGSAGFEWTTPTFDDSSWNVGATGIGYETSGTNYAPLLASRVPAGTPGFYARIRFDAQQLDTVDSLILRMKYDDGFIAYLNGERVADANGPSSPRFDSFAAGENSDDNAVVFAPFDISSSKDQLLPTGNVLAIHALNRAANSSDMLMLPELAYTLPGSTSPDQIGFFGTPTPDSGNGVPVAGFTAEVTIDTPHGFYAQPKRVTLATIDPTVEIRYTTDGSAPTATNGFVYTRALDIGTTTTLRAAGFKPGLAPSAIQTASYFFLSDIVTQTSAATLAAGFPTTWGGTTPDYGLDSKVIGPNDRFGGKYSDQLVDGLTAIPSLSITLDIDDMFGVGGIYTNPNNSNLEVPASLELINADGSAGFQIDAGLKIQGGAFRSFGLTNKKSFRFKFQSEYGPSKLEYPLFGDDATTSFDTLTLRMESNDGWQWDNRDNTNRLYARDEWNRRTQLAMGQAASHGTWTHVYINGFYWGMYNLVERPDESFASDYVGGDKEDWDIQNSGTAVNGDLNSWNEMLRLATEVRDLTAGSTDQLVAWNRLQGLAADGTDDPQQEAYLDVVNYIDYLIVNMYGGNSDWPHKNYYLGRQRGSESAGFQFFLWDAEWSLNLQSNLTTNLTGISSGVAQPFALLRNVPEFRLLFADRVEKHFAPGGTLYVDPKNPAWDPQHPERNVPAARFAEIVATIRDPLVAESARWGDQHAGPYTVDESWQPQVDYMLNTYFRQRSANVVTYFRNASLTSRVATPTLSDVLDPNTMTRLVEIEFDGNAVYYTTDGTDPRLPGGSIAPTAQRYESPLIIAQDTHLVVRAMGGTTWSALTEGVFAAAVGAPEQGELAISELHYNPADANIAGGELDVDNDEFEFVELLNVGQRMLDLGGLQFVETAVDGDLQGIRFTFATQSLAPGQSIVVVENVDAFRSRYGTAPRIAAGVDQIGDPVGEYGGQLSNAGELLTLVDATGTALRQFAYDDAWYAATDGEGASLELARVWLSSRAELEDAATWRASMESGGSPNAAILRGDFDLDEMLLATDVDLLYAAIAGETYVPWFDGNADAVLNAADLASYVTNELDTRLGDADLNGKVEFADFVILANAFGKAANSWSQADFDADGTVGFSDFVLLANNFGYTRIPPAIIPATADIAAALED